MSELNAAITFYCSLMITTPHKDIVCIQNNGIVQIEKDGKWEEIGRWPKTLLCGKSIRYRIKD